MKQNDWIVSGVCLAVGIIAVIVCITQARTPDVPPAPEQVPLSAVTIPSTPVAMGKELPKPKEDKNGGGGGAPETGGRGGGGTDSGFFGGGGGGASSPSSGTSEAPVKKNRPGAAGMSR